MNIKNKDFIENINKYFNNREEDFFNSLNNIRKSFFLNTNKANKEKILSLIDFNIEESKMHNNVYYYEDISIGKTIINDLGLIYPQDSASALSSLFIDKNAKLVLDMCSAPGGKAINILNVLDNDALLIANDNSYKRVLELSKNLERLGLDNVIITNKDGNDLNKYLNNACDLVILDAPCSGEGMIDKYPEILNNYSNSLINNLANRQKELLDNAYDCLKGNGQLLYSTCTYSFLEDEKQIESFLQRHKDMELIKLEYKDNYSTLDGTIKLCPLNNTEGQFICLMRKKDNDNKNKIKYLKEIKDKVVEDFIRNNLDIENYYLYSYDNKYYLSKNRLNDMGNNIIKYGILLGEKSNNIFKPNHHLYRANSLRNNFKYIYDLNDEELRKYLNGEELNVKLDNNYYLITYKDISLGFGKVNNNKLKNKYPKGLRRML